MNYISLLGFAAGYIALCAIGGILLIALIILCIVVPMKAWFTALLSRAYISMAKLTSMKFRKVNPMQIVETYIMVKKAKLLVTVTELETLYLAGGDCKKVISALILATSAKMPITFEQLQAIDLSDRDVTEVIENSIHTKIISMPDIRAIAQDNIEIIASVKLSVKLNINQILIGTEEETLKAKVAKHIIANIALSPNHQSILSAPQKLVEGILSKRYDEGSIYILQSADISNIDLGRDVGAEMVAKSAEKDRALAMVEAEKMKNMAAIREQQMKAKAQEMKSVVLAAEAEVPKAIAEAIKEGRFSVMDYYKLMNLQADTAMRRAIINKDDNPRGE